jgi:hypothetical protein
MKLVYRRCLSPNARPMPSACCRWNNHAGEARHAGKPITNPGELLSSHQISSKIAPIASSRLWCSSDYEHTRPDSGEEYPHKHLTCSQCGSVTRNTTSTFGLLRVGGRGRTSLDQTPFRPRLGVLLARFEAWGLNAERFKCLVKSVYDTQGRPRILGQNLKHAS